jgi:hypothetical protein
LQLIAKGDKMPDLYEITFDVDQMGEPRNPERVECSLVKVNDNGDLLLYSGPSYTTLERAYTAGYWLSCAKVKE